MNLIIAALIVASYFICMRLSSSAISRFGQTRAVKPYRLKYISKTVSIALLVFHLVLLISALGFEYTQVSIFLSSVFAVIGVALFAQWSILSNITASLIIFFGFPYRVGDKIRVMDKDDDISGTIEEITLFHVLIRRGEELITYPNTLILQKGVIKNPGKQLTEAPEKLPETSQAEAQ
ncbi:mechanosensitive ion channel domain-containing protein [Microbulbifer sp. THAF38]|uniref:mechanosensitive ion channel domain-containing protein n=1 Tax=Microbulbifer sp. THAF38 TaxID=2587856 RepID=UPI0012AA69E2|nr:mechanosensitive ion channel domain-containing protein [Microbulbifer sp. THAF38]QFT54404.1 Small-conductance mechanosensitive channel [Microbulbifer sp. THAF38]